MKILRNSLTPAHHSDNIHAVGGAWCSGLTCGPVKAEIAGSNPVAPAKKTVKAVFFLLTIYVRRYGILIGRFTSMILQGLHSPASKGRAFLLERNNYVVIIC